MFILNNQPLSPDRAFTTEDGTQFPANWLRLSSPEERAALGITETEDEPWYDQRFYWGPDLPKDHAQLVEQWVGQTKTTAGTLLAGSDWYITRQAETGTPTPADVLFYRLAVRDISGTKEGKIRATTTTDELAAYVTSADYSGWPTKDEPITQADDTISFDGVTSGSYFTATSIVGGFGNDTLTFN